MRQSIFIFFCIAAAAIGCRPEPEAVDLADQLVVATNYDPEADFPSYTTYAIPTDTVGFISNSSNDTIIVASRSNFPRPVLEAINQNMQGRGYSRVNRNENPDLGANVL